MVYHEGQWGTVCDDFFEDSNTEDQNNGLVACRSLGFLRKVSDYDSSTKSTYGKKSKNNLESLLNFSSERHNNVDRETKFRQ